MNCCLDGKVWLLGGALRAEAGLMLLCRGRRALGKRRPMGRSPMATRMSAMRASLLNRRLRLRRCATQTSAGVSCHNNPIASCCMSAPAVDMGVSAAWDQLSTLAILSSIDCIGGNGRG